MSQKPNIILINCDDLGYGDIGCYGSQTNRTPHLDRLAAEGLRFTDFYMPSPVCSPSRGGMLTGCYPKRIGFGTFPDVDPEKPRHHVLYPGDPAGLNPSEKTIASLLQEQGYETALVGKWHCGDQPDFLPTRHGFNHYYGLPYSNDMGCQRNKTKFRTPLPLMRGEEVIEEQPDQTGLTERYLEESIQFIRENREGPFFLYLAHMYVHLPLYVQDRFVEESENGRYGAAVACIDWVAGVLHHELIRLGLDTNTLVLFTSDNGSRAGKGGGSNLPLRGRKTQCWEGGQRVPLIAWWPGKIQPGSTTSNLTTAMDFLPTLVGLAGGKPPDDRIIDGVDFSDVLFRGDSAKSPRETFFYYYRDTMEAVRFRNWKLFFQHGEEKVRELYDLEKDPGETENLHSSEHGVVAELTALADKMREDIGDDGTGAPGSNCRPAGWVDAPQKLCEVDPDYPYYRTEYDLEESG